MQLHFFEALRLHKTEKEKENHRTNHRKKCSGGGGGGVYEGAITDAGIGREDHPIAGEET